MIIFIDLDMTVLDFKKAESEALKRTLLKFKIEPDEEKIRSYSFINDMLWKELEKGLVTRDELQVKRFDIFLKKHGFFVNPADVNEHYKRCLGQGHWFMDGAEELLKALYKKHRLFIASNGTKSVQTGRIESAGIKKYFEDIFLSEDIGFDKPQTRFFDECFKRISGFDKSDAIILGDSLSSDIQGGINAGIKTCWFNPEKKDCGDVLPDYTIFKLEEFLDIEILKR